MSIISTVIGRLTQDPDLNFSQNGKAYANFSIAVDHNRKNRQTNEWEKTGATFLRVTLWEHMAEDAAEKLRKGQRVIAQGQVVTRFYEDRDGKEGKSLEFSAQEIGPLLDKWAPKDQQPQGGGFGGGQAQSAADPWGGQPKGGGWGAPQGEEPPF